MLHLVQTLQNRQGTERRSSSPASVISYEVVCHKACWIFFKRFSTRKKVNLAGDIYWGKKLNRKTLCCIPFSLPFIFSYSVNTRPRSLADWLYNILPALRLQCEGYSASSSRFLLSWSLEVLWKGTAGHAV